MKPQRKQVVKVKLQIKW